MLDSRNLPPVIKGGGGIKFLKFSQKRGWGWGWEGGGEGGSEFSHKKGMICKIAG